MNNVMLSRIADSLFWLARYMERAEDTARILDVNYHMLLEQSATPYRLRWEPLITMAGEQERFSQFYREANAQTVYEFLAFRSDNPNSIVQCITKARENARTIRDRISREMWEDINGLYHSVTRFDPAEQISSGPHRFCDAVKFGSHRFFGVTDATLPHDEGWDFLKIGWSLERAEMTARLVDLQFQSLLETPLAEMLILHAKHPRSIRFSITELQVGLRAISGSNPGTYANEAERLTGRVLEGLRYDTVADVFRRGLHTYLANLLSNCRLIGEDIARTCFYYGAAA